MSRKTSKQAVMKFKTMEELIALSDQIVKDGGTPGVSTRFRGRNRLARNGLGGRHHARTQTPDVYDGWVANTVKFNDPRVVNAIETFGKFAKNNDYVEGDPVRWVRRISVIAPRMFTVPPKCYMHRQASFILHFFQKGLKSERTRTSLLPAFEAKAAQLGNPVLGGGTLMAITKTVLRPVNT